MSNKHLLCVLLATSLITGCGNGSNDLNVISSNYTSIANGGLTVNDSEVSLHSQGVPDATINAAGDLAIGGTAVSLNAAQRELLLNYYHGALAVREHGIATGKAGAAVAGEALRSVAAGLTSGNPDQIGKRVDAKAAQVDQAAMKICLDMDTIKTAQDELTGQLPAFKPYAGIISSGEITDCSKDRKS